MNKLDIFNKVKEHALEEINQMKMIYNNIDDERIKKQILKIIESYSVLVNIINPK